MESTGETWKNQRRFVIRGLKEFGFGLIMMETKIQIEVQHCIDQLKSKGVVSFDPRFLLQRSIANVISGLLYGGSLFHRNRFKQFMEFNDDNLRLDGVSSILNFFPIWAQGPFLNKLESPGPSNAPC